MFLLFPLSKVKVGSSILSIESFSYLGAILCHTALQSIVLLF